MVLTAALCVLAWARTAAADCSVDTDCPGATCGSSVCQWSVGGHNCVAAGTDLQGYDGRCGNDAQCKCSGEGATCTASQYCTFTVPAAATTPSDASTSTSTADAGTATTPSCTVTRAGSTTPDWIALTSIAGAAFLLGKRRPRR